MIELVAAELAHGENGEFGRRRTEALAKFRVPIFEYLVERNLRDQRQLERRFLERGDVGEFAQGDPSHLASFPVAQRAKIIGRNRAGAPSLQIGQHPARTAALGADIALPEPEQSLRVPDEARHTNARHGEEVQQGRFA